MQPARRWNLCQQFFWIAHNFSEYKLMRKSYLSTNYSNIDISTFIWHNISSAIDHSFFIKLLKLLRWLFAIWLFECDMLTQFEQKWKFPCVFFCCANHFDWRNHKFSSTFPSLYCAPVICIEKKLKTKFFGPFGKDLFRMVFYFFIL